MYVIPAALQLLESHPSGAKKWWPQSVVRLQKGILSTPVTVQYSVMPEIWTLSWPSKLPLDYVLFTFEIWATRCEFLIPKFFCFTIRMNNQIKVTGRWPLSMKNKFSRNCNPHSRWVAKWVGNIAPSPLHERQHHYTLCEGLHGTTSASDASSKCDKIMMIFLIFLSFSCCQFS